MSAIARLAVVAVRSKQIYGNNRETKSGRWIIRWTTGHAGPAVGPANTVVFRKGRYRSRFLRCLCLPYRLLLGTWKRPVRRGICFHRLGVLPALLRGVAGYLGEAVSRLCVETYDFEDRSRMKRFGGQMTIGLSDGNVQGVSGGCRRFSHSDTRLFPRQEKPADIVPEEMAVISFGSQLHARRPGVVRFPTETGRPAVRWPLCVWQGGDNIEGPACSRPFDMSCGSAGYGYSNILSISAFVSGLWPRNLT